MRILDVGSGSGKFCLVGALTSPGVFVGVEQRPHLVRVARRAARRLGLSRCQFIHGDVTTVDWGDFDGVYLFNPFAELLPGFGRLDRTIDASHDRFREHVRAVRAALRRARVGTRVVTFHGFGARMTAGWRRVTRDYTSGGWLELWVKTSVSAPAARTDRASSP